VGWVAFAGTRAEGLLALVLALATITLGEIVIIAPAIGVFDWGGWTEGAFALLLTWFMGLVLRRQLVLIAELRLLRDETERRRHQTEALYQADEHIYRSLRLDEVLESLVDVASDLLRPDKVAVGMLDAQTDRVLVGASRGFSATQRGTAMCSDQGTLNRFGERWLRPYGTR
jgi:K+-sensing histidine kinase KdpD